MRCSLTVAVAALVCALGASAAAQLSNKEAPAIVGHFHLNVTSVEAHRKFWVDTLGGTADEDRRAGRHPVPRHRADSAGAAADRPNQRHGVRSHRLRGAGRSRADDESRGERLSADDRPRARAWSGGHSSDGNRRALREVLRICSARTGRRSNSSPTRTRAGRPSSITTCISSTSSTSRCSSGT